MTAAARAVVLVGRGRMGAALARALRAAGVSFRVLPGRALAEGRRVRFARGAARRVTWVLAVTDRAVARTAAALAERGWLARGDAVLHLSGMLGPEALAVVRASGASAGAMHPLVAVAVPREPPALGPWAAASFDGDRAALPAARALCGAIGVGVVPLGGADRVRYHAAAALVATGSVALAQGAAALFRAAAPALGERGTRAFVRSLLTSVAHNVAVAGPAGALASPLLRGETDTVERHLASMAVEPHARALYLAALTQVLDTLERGSALPADVLARAHGVLARSDARG